MKMFSRRQAGKVVLVSDLDDMSVGVSLVRFEKTGAPTVIASQRTMLPIEERSKDQAAAGIVQALDETVAKLMKAATDRKVPPPRGAYAILHAPWTRFRTAFAEEAYEKPRTATKDLITGIAKKALALPSELDKNAILESGTMQVYVNGYATGNPVGKKATRVGVVAYESDVDQGIKKNVIATLQKHLTGRTVLVRSSMCAMLAVLGEHLPDIHRFVILDIGGTATNCAVILKESVSQSAIVPEGVFTIIKRISSVGLPEEVLTQLRMLATDTCSTDACKALQDSLAQTEPSLTKIFGEAFSQLASKRRLPNAAMLSAPLELSPWLQSFFGRIDFSQFTATMQPLDVEPLTPDHVQKLVSWDSKARSDTGLGIAAGYVHILEQNS